MNTQIRIHQWLVVLLTALAFPIVAHAQTPTHKLAIQVDVNDPATMNLALNNAENVISFYEAKKEPIQVEVVAYGPGLHMLRADTSPVKQRIAQMSLAHDNLRFDACEVTRAKMAEAEHKDIPIVTEGKSVPSGVVTLMELEGKGYAYVRP